MSDLVKAELSATCNTLGYLHNGIYTVDPQCYESVRDLIRFLRRDDEYHEIRRYLGEAKIVQSDLIHIIENCTEEQNDLFDITIRLLVNLTSPLVLLYKEELPVEKVGRNIYLNLLGHLQECKLAFSSIEAWKKISSKLSDLFEIDWSERSEDSGLLIERMLVLIRNVLQIPADDEGRAENDVNMHDQVLWGLRQSQILELLLYISSNRNEEQYFIHILEIFSLILREQDAKLLANCEISRSTEEKQKDIDALLDIRQNEKITNTNKLKKYTRHSNFGGTYVIQSVKSISDKSLIYHKPLQKISTENSADKKKLKTPKNRIPEKTERDSRRSTFSVRLFLKELCVEFLSSSYNGLMSVVKDKIVSGRALPNDESYYFWALKFFMEFNRLAKLDVKHVSETINAATFHFIQTQVENCFDRILPDKKKMNVWVKRLHIILKAYRELLETLNWLDQTENKHMSQILKSQVFYMPEYRELVIHCLLKYDPTKYSKEYIRTLLETTHIFLKLFKNFCEKRHNKVVVQKKTTKKQKKRKRENPAEKWKEIKELVTETLTNNSEFPDISPLDPNFELESEEQKESSMRRIQNYLYENKIIDGIGLLRSARKFWPEVNYFGYEGMDKDEELTGLESIFIAELGNEVIEEEEEEDEEKENKMEYKEQVLDYTDFVKKLAHKKIVEACAVLLQEYQKNTTYTNHCIVKMLYRIGWECYMPSMLYQATFFLTLLKILRDNRNQYKELNQFSVHLIRKFRQNAVQNPKIYMELLFWKDTKIAYDVENGYENRGGKGKTASWSEEQEDELRRLCVEFDQTNPENSDKVDWIMTNLIDKSRSRRAITRKLRELYLIPAGPVTRIKKRPPIEWAPEEEIELRTLFEQFQDAMDIVGVISDRLSVPRPKKRIADKILELGLVENRSQLRKKRGRRADVESESESESDQDETETAPPSEEPQVFSIKEQKLALKKVTDLGMKEGLEWLKECFQDYLDDYDPDDGCPLLALDQVHAEALENEDFTNMLKKLGVTLPAEQQYWRIPGSFTKQHIQIIIENIQKALSGTLEVDIDENSVSQRSVHSENLLEIDETSSSGLNSTLQTNKDSDVQPRTRKTITSEGEDSEDSRSSLTGPVSSQVNKKRSVKSKQTIDSEGEESDDSRSSFKGTTSQRKKMSTLNSDDSSPSHSPRPSSRKTVQSGAESSEGSHSSFKLSKQKKSRPKFRRIALDSNSDNDDGSVAEFQISNGFQSDSDSPSNSKVSTFVKRSRILINSDSEGEAVDENNDFKRRRTLDSDSEGESVTRPRRIVIGEDTYEMEK